MCVRKDLCEEVVLHLVQNTLQRLLHKPRKNIVTKLIVHHEHSLDRTVRDLVEGRRAETINDRPIDTRGGDHGLSHFTPEHLSQSTAKCVV